MLFATDRYIISWVYSNRDLLFDKLKIFLGVTMYHEEKVINGILHYRGTPRSDWTAYTLEELTARLVHAEFIISLNNQGE